MIKLIHHSRKLILLFSFLLSIFVFLYIDSTTGTDNLLKIRLSQYFALIATVYLYLALLASPLYSVFPNFPYKPLYIRARRALGQSAFYFATLHACISFFGLLGGFAGLKFLTTSYLQAISLSFSAYLILAVMATTGGPQSC